MATDYALPYHEPGIVTILILASFLLILNVVNHVLDRIMYVGLLGQVVVGIIWGTPVGAWLGTQVEAVAVNLGYLGLLLLVYEGGLTTSFKSLKADLWLSTFVALTGISLPIALSYFLIILANATPFQAFAAGAALCSTSLGTTFTVLQTSGLNGTRMGVVLTTAAMMDDIVGLVMVQVISNLGKETGSFTAITVIRPIFVSLAFGLAVPLACRFLVLPVTTWIINYRTKSPDSVLSQIWAMRESAFVVHTAVLVGMITAASYAGTSNLFAAYLTGAGISWWDSDAPHAVSSLRDPINSQQANENRPSPRSPLPQVDSPDDQITSIAANQGIRRTQGGSTNAAPHPATSIDEQCKPDRNDATNGICIFERYYAQPLQRILKPFFFASIGFSIPIKRMFNGGILWRGIVYTVLMSLAKLACGIWLTRIPVPAWLVSALYWSDKPGKVKRVSKRFTATLHTSTSNPTPQDNSTTQETEPSKIPPQDNSTTQETEPSKIPPRGTQSHETARLGRPISLYPSAIVGCAMVARGEIGFLISSLAEANGIFGQDANGSLFLIVTWAIMLCTVTGPICVGLLARRLKRLSSTATEGPGRTDVLGIWGFN